MFCNKEFQDILVIYWCLWNCSEFYAPKRPVPFFFLLYTRWFRHFVYKDPYKDKFCLVSQHFPPLIYALNMSPKMQRFVSQDNWFTDRLRMFQKMSSLSKDWSPVVVLILMRWFFWVPLQTWNHFKRNQDLSSRKQGKESQRSRRLNSYYIWNVSRGVRRYRCQLVLTAFIYGRTLSCPFICFS